MVILFHDESGTSSKVTIYRNCDLKELKRENTEFNGKNIIKYKGHPFRIYTKKGGTYSRNIFYGITDHEIPYIIVIKDLKNSPEERKIINILEGFPSTEKSVFIDSVNINDYAMMEYYDTDLSSFLRSINLSINNRELVAKKIAYALNYLYERGHVCYTDMKLEQILVKHSKSSKSSDKDKVFNNLQFKNNTYLQISVADLDIYSCDSRDAIVTYRYPNVSQYPNIPYNEILMAWSFGITVLDLFDIDIGTYYRGSKVKNFQEIIKRDILYLEDMSIEEGIERATKMCLLSKYNSWKDVYNEIIKE